MHEKLGQPTLSTGEKVSLTKEGFVSFLESRSLIGINTMLRCKTTEWPRESVAQSQWRDDRNTQLNGLMSASLLQPLVLESLPRKSYYGGNK